jgi:hypothetical protein
VPVPVSEGAVLLPVIGSAVMAGDRGAGDRRKHGCSDSQVGWSDARNSWPIESKAFDSFYDDDTAGRASAG